MRKIAFTLFLILAPLLSLQAGERTLAIIKPDAVKANHIGEVLSRYEKNGMKIVALKMVYLTPSKAKDFYRVHKDRPFFNDLSAFMSSGPSVVLVLEGDNAIQKNRSLMGATDPQEASPGTIRAELAASKQHNAVHGSDSADAAKEEINFFFGPGEIHPAN